MFSYIASLLGLNPANVGQDGNPITISVRLDCRITVQINQAEEQTESPLSTENTTTTTANADIAAATAVPGTPIISTPVSTSSSITEVNTTTIADTTAAVSIAAKSPVIFTPVSKTTSANNTTTTVAGIPVISTPVPTTSAYKNNNTTNTTTTTKGISFITAEPKNYEDEDKTYEDKDKNYEDEDKNYEDEDKNYEDEDKEEDETDQCLSPKEIFLDYQGYFNLKRTIVVKELAAVEIINYGDYQQDQPPVRTLMWATLKSPFQIDVLDNTRYNIYMYLRQYYHGIPWNVGTTSPIEAFKTLSEIVNQAKLNDSSTIFYAKGLEKAKYFSELLGIHVEDYGETKADNMELPEYTPECPYHSQYSDHYKCSLKNLYRVAEHRRAVVNGNDNEIW